MLIYTDLYFLFLYESAFPPQTTAYRKFTDWWRQRHSCTYTLFL